MVRRLTVLAGQLGGEFRYALRRLRRSPGFAAFAIVSLALGIGTTTAIYSVVHFLLWRPLGILEPERIVDVRGDSYVPGQPTGSRLLSGPDFEDLARQQRAFSSLAAYLTFQLPVIHDGQATLASGEAVSDNYFQTFGVQAAAGRVIGPADNANGAPRVAVVSERFSLAKFGSETAALGRVVKIAGGLFQIVGVIPASFPGSRTQSFLRPNAVWVPLAAGPELMSVTLAPVDLGDRTRRRLNVQGRLAPNRTVDDAARETALIGRRLEASFPTSGASSTDAAPAGRRWSAQLASTADQSRPDTVGAVVIAAVAMVLLIACTNLANLSLARGSARHAELTVRRALGASRGRLIREQLIESVIITLAGSALSAAVVRWILVASTAEIPVSRAAMVQLLPELNWPVAVLATGAIVLTILIFGLWPAMQITRANLRGGLSEDSATAPPRWRAHRALVAWQVTGSVVLLLIAAACVRGLASQDIDPGVDIDRLALAELDFQVNGRNETQARSAIDGILDVLQRQPGVEAAAASYGLPFGVISAQRAVTALDKPFAEGRDIGENACVVSGTAGIFRTLGVEILRGLPFSDEQVRQRSHVIVLTEKLALSVFGTADVVGRPVLLGGQSMRSGEMLAEEFTVVGIAADVDTFTMGRRQSGAVFLPFATWFDIRAVPFNPSVIFTARTSGDSSDLISALRGSIRAVDSDLAVGMIGTGSTLLSGPVFFLRVVAWLSTSLGVLALVLAMSGLYGVLSHVVVRRTRELGVRMALGATSGRLVRMVLADGWRPVRLGLVIGLVLGVLCRLGLRAALPVRLSAVDPVAFSVVPVLMIVAAFLACYLPARRASRVDPNTALKNL